MRVRVAGEEITTTPEHPFFVDGEGWTPAGEMQEGQRLSTPAGGWLPIEAVTAPAALATVDNLRVADFPTYFVATPSCETAVWVHNTYDAPAGVIYKRTDLNGEIKPYVGQAESDSRFLARQKEHARKHPDADFEFEEIARADPGDALDIAEHKALQELTGGQRAKNSPLVSNLKDPVGPNRRPGFGLPEPRE